jgi:hypothetical protein
MSGKNGREGETEQKERTVETKDVELKMLSPEPLSLPLPSFHHQCSETGERIGVFSSIGRSLPRECFVVTLLHPTAIEGDEVKCAAFVFTPFLIFDSALSSLSACISFGFHPPVPMPTVKSVRPFFPFTISALPSLSAYLAGVPHRPFQP